MARIYGGEVVDPPVVDPGGRPGGLGERIRDTIASAFLYFLDLAVDTLVDIGKAMGVAFLERLEPTIKDWARPYGNTILGNPHVPEEIKAPIRAAFTEGEPVSGLILMALLMAALNQVIGAALSPISTMIAMGIDKSVETARPGPDTAHRMVWRGGLSPQGMVNALDELGWDGTLINAWGEVARPRLPVGDLVRSLRRGDISDAEFRAEVGKRGYTGGDIDNIVRLSFGIPGPGDLVRFALREAWRDDIAAKYGYDAEFVPQFQEYMEKQGLGGDWPRLYWRSHWVVPSPTAGYEMLHRGVIDEGELNDLLKIADYPAGWRDKLIAISYSPYTRVDVRRMYNMGILDEADVYHAYRDIGYDEEKATNLTNFTIALYVETEREATKADVLSAYKDGRMPLGEVVGYLQALGYTEMAVDLAITKIDYAKTEKAEKSAIAVVKALYVSGEYDEPDVWAALGPLTLPDAQVQELLTLWRIERARKIKTPSVGQLEEFYKHGIIDLTAFRHGLDKQGYIEGYIDQFAQNLDYEVAIEAAKEAERMGKEQERIALSAFKTATRIEKAGLDVDIAEARLGIANSKLALWDVVTMEQQQDLLKGIDTLKVTIAELQVERAEIPVAP